MEYMENISEEIIAAKNAGFSNEEIKQNYSEEINAAKAAGFTQEEINKEFGFKDIDRSVFKDLISFTKEDIKAKLEARKVAGEKVKEVIVGKEFDGDYILEQILGNNLYNLGYRASQGKGLPESMKKEVPEDYTWTEEFLTTAGSLALETPIFLASAIPGFLAGGPIGSGFTGAAIPSGTRKALIKVLENQDENKPSDAIKILLEEALPEAAKEGTKFAAATALPLLKVPGLGPLAQNYFSRTAAQIAGYEGAGTIINGELPEWREFTLSSAMFGLFNLFIPKKIATAKTKKIFEDYGINPTQVAQDSSKSRILREDLLSTNMKKIRKYSKEETIEIPEKEIKVVKTQPRFKDPIANKAAENISFEQDAIPITYEQIKETAKTAKRKFVVSAIDQKYPVLEAMRDLGLKTKTGVEKLNTYEVLRLQEGMQGRSGHFIEFGTLDFNTLSENGPSLMSIVKPFVKEKSEINLFSTYLTNRQGLSLAERSKETGIDIDNAKIFIKKYSNKKVTDPETGKKISYEEAAKKIDLYNEALLKYASDGGLITKESYDAFRTINKNYVPMARELPRPGESGFIKGASNPFKRLKGSKLKIIDPLESIVKNTDYIVRMTELNKVKNDFIDMVELSKVTNSAKFDWVVEKKAKLKPINVQRKELERFFDKKEIDKLSDKAVEEITIFRQEAVYPDANSISVRRDGKYKVYEVGEDIATAFRVMDNPGMKWWQKFLSAPTRTLRTGAIITPDFALPNFFKDTMNATFLSKVGWLPIVDSIKGMFFVIFKDPKKATEAYKRFLKSGGAQSTLRSIDRSMFDADVHSILNKGVMRNEYKGLLGPFRYLTELSEDMTRVAMNEKVYKIAKKKGLSERESLERAGFEARDLLDYAKKGIVGASVNRYSAFWNARVQGATKIYEAFRDRPARATAMVGLSVILPTIGFYVSNLDENGELDKDYKEIPDYIKNNKYYTKINGEGRYFPKGYEVGTFFASLTEKVLDYIRAEEKPEFLEFVKDFGYQHIKGYNPIPIWMKPHIENLMDYSFFRDAAILPPNAPKDMLNQYYSTEYTTPVLIKLSENLAELVGADNYFANPIYLENIYDSYFGSIGRMVKDSINTIAISSGVIEDPIKPEDPLTKIPGIRVFQAKDVYGYSKSINEFYKQTEDYNKLFATVDYLLKTNNTKDYLKEIKKVNFDVKAVIDIMDAMKSVSEDIKIIYNAKKKQDGTLFTPEQKRDLIDDLYKVRIAFAQKGLKIMKNVEQK